jgi:hypothetical protein
MNYQYGNSDHGLKNYLDILQLPENAGRDDIKQAYRHLAKQYHPDVNKAPDAHEKFCAITEAYEFLMDYWPRYTGKYSNNKTGEQKFSEHQHTDIFEQFQREAQEKARRQARMRYEKFRQQHDAFQESGINDIGLLFTILMRFLSLFLFLFLLLAPVILTIVVHWNWIFVIFFMWPFAIGIAWYYRDNKKNYFHPGNFYYSPDRIRHLFIDRQLTTKKCHYCRGRLADSRPYKLDLLKLKDVKIKTGGYRQHNVNYVNQNISVFIPRSRKAFIIHSINILIKLLSIAGCIIFLNIASITWRILLGFFLGGILSRTVLTLTATKSNTTYLFSLGLIIRLVIWITGIVLASRFYFEPFDIYATEAIQFVIFSIIIFDSFLMQIISMVLGKLASYPMFGQFSETTEKFSEGYIVYNDVPVISFIYPLFKWLFG